MLLPYAPGWAYLRKSQNEENDPTILDRHRALLERVAATDEREIPLGNVFEEIGSGELIETRPAFLSLLRLWESLPRDSGGVVYVVELARLTRGLLSDQGRVMDALMRAHILIRTPHRYYDLRVFDDRFAFMAYGLVANAELELGKQRFANAKESMLLAGLIRTGQVPWGYRWSKEHERVEITDDFPLLVRCCQEIHYTSVARLAARYGVNPARLHQTLKNPMICGCPVKHFVRTEQRRKNGGAVYVRGPRSTWVWPLKENTSYPHACTREEWEAIQQALLARRTRMEKTGALNGWCRDVVRFEGVERPPRLGRYCGRAGAKATYEVRDTEGKLLYVDRGLVHQAAVDAIQAALADPKQLAVAVLEWQAEKTAELLSGVRQTTIEELTAMRDRHQRQAVELLQRELDAEGAARRTIAELRRKKEVEIDRLEEEMQTLCSRVEVPPAFERLLPGLPVLALKFEQEWGLTSDEEKRLLVNTFLRELTVRIEVGERACWRKRTVLPPVYQEWVPPLLPAGGFGYQHAGNNGDWDAWPWRAAA